MSFFVLWTVFLALIFCLEVLGPLIVKADKELVVKEGLTWGYLLLAASSIFLPETLYEIRWALGETGYSWGWLFERQKVLFVLVLFLINVFEKDAKYISFARMLLASSVVLSAYTIQTSLLFAAFSYLLICEKPIKTKLLFYPSALFVFLSYENIWSRSEFVALPEYLKSSTLQLLVAALVIFYIYHIALIFKDSKKLKPRDLINISLCQYITCTTLSNYLDTPLLTSYLGFLVGIATFCTVMTLRAKSIERMPWVPVFCLVFIMCIYGLLPTELNISYFVISVLGFVEIYTVNKKDQVLRSSLEQIELVYLKLIKSMAPLSLIGLWPLYEFSQSTGFQILVSVLLLMTVISYSMSSLSHSDFQVRFDDIKVYKHAHLLSVFKIILLFVFLSAFVALTFEVFSKVAVLKMIFQNSLNGVIFLLWMTLLVCSVYLQKKSVYLSNLRKLKSDMPAAMLPTTCNLFESVAKNLFDSCVITLSFLCQGVVYFYDTIINILEVMIHGLSRLFSTLEKKQEIVCMLMLSFFFMFYMWRYSS